MVHLGLDEGFWPEFHPGRGFPSLFKAVAMILGLHLAGLSTGSVVVEVPDLGFN